MADLHVLSAVEQAKKLHTGEITSVELTQLSLDTIDKTEDDINAYISVTADLALEKAKEVDKRIQSGDIRSPLAGVPIGIKDNLCLKNT